MKEFIKRFIPREIDEADKSEAQKETEARADKYTEFFKQPLESLKKRDKQRLATAYKIVAGFFINSDKLDSTRSKLSFKDRLKEKRTIGQKAAFVCATGAKIIAKTALGSVQFVVRNSIKQPAMLIFRLGAGVNNLRKYRKAKRTEDQTRIDAELANLKYQAQETRNAIIGTAVTAAIIISTLGSAGITASFFGAASAAVATTASAIDTAALANDTAQGTFKQAKGREEKGVTDHALQEGVELLPIRKPTNKKNQGAVSHATLPYNKLSQNEKHL